MITKCPSYYYLSEEKIAVQEAMGDADNFHGHDFLELAYIKRELPVITLKALPQTLEREITS